MKALRKMLLVAGSGLLVFGLLFAAQGAGLFPYPERSFMVGASPWIGYGLIIALVGAGLVVLSRRV